MLSYPRVLLDDFSRKQETEQKNNVYTYLRKSRAMTISVGKEKNESTTKGSDRILESKTTPNIVDPEHATRHVAEAFWAIVALHVSVI